MSLRRLTAFVVLVEICALGVFFAALLGMATARGGVLTIDMTRHGEMWLEYWVMVLLVATFPYVLYVFDSEQKRE